MSSSTIFWRVNDLAARLPGRRHLFRVYKTLTSLVGEGRVYTIRHGPMRGLRWRRYNALPYWYHTGRYEPGASDFILRHLQRGDVFWDLGANAGYHALAAARAVGPEGLVVAVEPDPDTVKILREQLALNGVRHCVVVEQAVADRPGTLMLVLRDEDRRGDSLEAVHNPSIDNAAGRRVPVAVTTLDELAARFPAPALLKIDIEGAEALMLPQARAFFESGARPRFVLLAYHGHALYFRCMELMREYGYELERWPGVPSGVDVEFGTLVAVDVRAAHVAPGEPLEELPARRHPSPGPLP